MRTYIPRAWPDKAKAARDGAAENLAAALVNMIPLTELETDAERLRKITRVVIHIESALRHLESAGAKTRPTDL